jgi:ABC-type Na+ efflux pump permease subunit
MFAIVAGLVFSIAFLLAIGTIFAMFALYHDKMVAALQFQPIPKETPAYQLRIRRPRIAATERRMARPTHAGLVAA